MDEVSVWRRAWTYVVTTLAQSLPNRCLLCHQTVIEGSGVCSLCLQRCLYHGPVCLGCGRSLVNDGAFCGACRVLGALPVIAPCSYHQGLGASIAAIKYQGQFAALDVLCRALMARVTQLTEEGEIPPVSLLLPVPLHPKRLKTRGFNQAYEIALLLSKLSGIPLCDDLLRRRRDTQPQAGLTGKARRKNLLGAFELTGSCHQGSVALVDDVVTTGSTANEIATMLQLQGVRVQVWCLARAEAPGLLDTFS
ncbi:ComF family protein [Shewanella amazonensis]|uniref:Competence protein ComF n=1 Tax=Shewanella amazonensis (strain ATCC BAA-1098 / SB2B) TaxID=326297 RepID=A1SBF0_SHEAM|nr:ComF family protein [Shewanella amazonensis]ABM01707.1 competence protein ComF [Shewanella amazonensis SB2B]